MSQIAHLAITQPIAHHARLDSTSHKIANVTLVEKLAAVVQHLNNANFALESSSTQTEFVPNVQTNAKPALPSIFAPLAYQKAMSKETFPAFLAIK